MDDFIPFLIFALISAASAIIENRKKKKEQKELEELGIDQEELDAETSNFLLDQLPPEIRKQLAPELEPEKTEAPKTRMPAKSFQELSQSQNRTSAQAPPVPVKQQPPPVVSDRQSSFDATSKELERAQKLKTEASQKLKEAQKKTVSKPIHLSKQKAQTVGFGVEKDSGRVVHLFKNPDSIRNAFIGSVVFDKPLGMKDDAD